MTNAVLLKLTTAVALLSSGVAAHGYVQGIVADNVFYQGYRPSFQYLASPPRTPGWSDPKNLDNGFISNYSSPNIICHLDATPAQSYAEVQAGGSVQLQWTPWPSGHLGPVLTYLANCNGECTTVDKTKLLFNKIDEAGLIQGGSHPLWASTELIANNNSWTVTIPSDLAPGNYVLRHEIIGLEEAMAFGGAQNYPQCVNIKVTGSGNNSLQTGTFGTSLYQSTDPGLYVDIYNGLKNYTIPGPPLISDAKNRPQPNFNSTASTTSTSFSATTTTSSLVLNNGATSVTSTTATSSSSSMTSIITVVVSSSSSTTSQVSTSSSASSTSTSTTPIPLVFATVSTSTISTSTSTSSASMVTTDFGAYPTTLQTLTILNTSTPMDSSTSFQETSTSTEVVLITVTVPGVFADPSTLTSTSSSSTTTTIGGGAFYPINNGTSWNGTAWSSGVAWSTGTAWSSGVAYSTGTGWSSGAAPSNPACTGYPPSNTENTWETTTTPTAVPIDNGYKSKRSMRIARNGYRQR